MHDVLHLVEDVMDRMTIDTAMGRILMPGPTYLGMWARDTGVATLGLNRIGRTELAGELLARYWGYQITEDSDPDVFVFRNKGSVVWTESDTFRPTRKQLVQEVGAFPTSVYIETPDFPAGTRELYTTRADLDSVGWLVIALHDHCTCSGDISLIRKLAPQVDAAMSYLSSRDVDGDHLLEQNRNQDWADTLLRHGKVAYTQAVWFASLRAASEIWAALGDMTRAECYRTEATNVRGAIAEMLLGDAGYYYDVVTPQTASLRRSLDTALLVAFGAAEGRVAEQVMWNLASLEGPFGAAVNDPGYSDADMGPVSYPPGQYHNEGVWPWIAAYHALGWSRIGAIDRAEAVIHAALGPQPRTVFEWVNNLNGDRHHPDFATGAGAIAWAISEGGLASRDPGDQGLDPTDDPPSG